MTIIRNYNDYCLNEGYGMSKGMYNVSFKGSLSAWLDEYEANYLIDLSGEEFKNECIKLLNL